MDGIMIREARVFANADLMTPAIAEETLRIARDAVAKRGRCSVCLSGGTTPKALNEVLAREYASRVPWNQMHFYWGDERYVPHDNPHSNYLMAKESLFSRLAVPSENIHPMPTNYPEPDSAAREYEVELRRFFGAQPAFDLLFLGIGPEGHTASLFPNSPALKETERWVLSAEVPADPPSRLTLTYPVINRARNILFLAAGSGKRGIIEAIRRDPGGPASQYPAARVDAARIVWFLDQAATF
jgi:6-phosphogluconolactonase